MYGVNQQQPALTVVPEDNIMADDHKEPSLDSLDGISHINVDIQGKTALGRSLTPTAKCGFTHPVFGYFCSFEGFWIYIRTNGVSDESRYLHGKKAKVASRQMAVGQRVNYFREIMAEAVYYKIVQNPRLSTMVAKSELPFDSYYIHKTQLDGVENSPGLAVRPELSSMFCEWFEAARKHIKEGTTPAHPDYGDALAKIRAKQRGRDKSSQ